MKIIPKKLNNISKYFIGFVTCILLVVSYLNLNKKIEISNEDALRSVGEVAVLPNDEKPTIAIVSNLEQLIGNQFFKNAKLGDKVIIYAKSKKAILYRAEENKIIEIGSLNLNNI